MSLLLLSAGGPPGGSGSLPANVLLWDTAADPLLFDTATDYLIWS